MRIVIKIPVYILPFAIILLSLGCSDDPLDDPLVEFERAPFSSNGNVAYIFINDNDEIFAGSDGIYISKDDGITWSYKAQVKGLVASIASNSEGQIFVVGCCALFRSTDNGAIWTSDDSFVGPNSIAISPTDIIYVGAISRVYRSDDNGETWTNSNSGFPEPRNFIITMTTNSKGYIVAGLAHFGGVFRSIDEGVSWIDVNNGIPNSSILEVVSSDDDIIYAGTGFNGVYRSRDDGVNWESIGLSDRTILSLTINKSGHIFAGVSSFGSDGGVYYSTNGGVKWNYLGPSGESIYSIAITSSGRIFAGAFRKVYRSKELF